MKDLKFHLQEYCCIKQYSAALPSKTYQNGESEITFSGALDNEYDDFLISFDTSSSIYRAEVKSNDRKTWNITPALQEQVNNTTLVAKFLPIKAIEPGDIPSLAQVNSIVNRSILDSTTTNAVLKTYSYKTTYRKSIDFFIPESRYLIGLKIYAKEKSSSEDFIEINPYVRYDVLENGQTVTINLAVQLYELLFLLITSSKTEIIQPKA